MEAVRKKMTCTEAKAPLLTQLTFDDDVNLAESSMDIREIVMQNGQVRLEEMRVLKGKIRLSGHLEFSVLYSGEDNGMLSCIHGDFTFEEMVNYDEGCEGQQVQVLWNLEDLRAQMIHSRKMNIKAIVTFTLYPYAVENLEPIWDLGEEPGMEKLHQTYHAAALEVCRKDTMRLKEEFLLPGGKPDIDRIIYRNVQLRNIRTRGENGFLAVNGDLAVFLLYLSADEQLPLQWVEKQIPFSGEIPVSDAADTMQSASLLQLSHSELAVSEDEDGEMRKILLEAVCFCDVMLFEEKTFEILADVYQPEVEFSFTAPQVKATSLDICNDSRMKLNLNMKLQAGKPLIQIIYSGVQVKVEEMHPKEEGLLLEGIVQVQILYQQADPENPYAARYQEFPFQYTAAIPSSALDAGEKIQISATTEQQTAVISSADEAEIRMTAGFRIVCCRETAFTLITDIEKKPVSEKLLENLPGVIGYVVKPGDTLWSVARQFYVPLASIREVNSLTTDELQPGQKLLICRGEL